MFCMLKKKKHRKHILLNSHSEKLVLFFNDFKWRKKLASCSKKTINTVKRNCKKTMTIFIV